MPRPLDDIDAVRKVLSVLAPFDNPTRERILRWVREKFHDGTTTFETSNVRYTNYVAQANEHRVQRNSIYDFTDDAYASSYPNLHKYPGTMLPQIGIELFKELNITRGVLLDPYCGSGSSFIVGLERGLTEMYGYDMNPLAVLISQAKFSKVDLDRVKLLRRRLLTKVYGFGNDHINSRALLTPMIHNLDYWFSKQSLRNLSILKYFLDKIEDRDVQRIFLIAFSETIRECSYSRNTEFKLYKMRVEDVDNFRPEVLEIYFDKLNRTIDTYERYYLPRLSNVTVDISNSRFSKRDSYFDVVLTSPPYGDSKTTVAYGQFSRFSNEWLGIQNARQIDSLLMGGKTAQVTYNHGVMADYIIQVAKESPQRSLEVSSYYYDLESSIIDVAKSVRRGGKVIYVVGNRRVKNIQLPTDQFIAEKFKKNGFKHLFTYERHLGNKVMPLQNSPSNTIGELRGTMTKEYIVVCMKH